MLFLGIFSNMWIMNYIFISGLSFLQTRTVKRSLIFSTHPPALQLTKEVQNILCTGSRKTLNVTIWDENDWKEEEMLEFSLGKILFGCATHSLSAPNQLPEYCDNVTICDKKYWKRRRNVTIFLERKYCLDVQRIPSLLPISCQRPNCLPGSALEY